MHFFDIGGAVKTIRIGKMPVQTAGQHGADRRLAGAGDAHDDKNARLDIGRRQMGFRCVGQRDLPKG